MKCPKTVLNVPIPKNCWLTLKRSHRFQQVPELKKLFDAFQSLFLQRYDIRELSTEPPDETDAFFPAFNPIRHLNVPAGELIPFLRNELESNLNRNRLFVMCHDKVTLQQINNFLKSQKIPFQTTHDDINDQAAKKCFTEDNDKLSTCTIASSQGLNIEDVFFVLSGNLTRHETVAIAITRPSKSLCILDLGENAEYTEFFRRYCSH